MSLLTCFKAYDIRGELGVELNEDIAYRIGRAYGELLKPKSMVVGGDVRLSSESLKNSLAQGLLDAGTDVFDIGMSGTEEVYFATFHLNLDGGVEVTASHNPMNYNGMKLVRENARPISGDTGLFDIKRMAEVNDFPPVVPKNKGKLKEISILDEYVDHLMKYIDLNKLTKKLKLIFNSGNGAAGHVVDAIEKKFLENDVPIEFVKINHNPDGNFPNGIPNPLLPECRRDTSDAVIKYNADAGIAFDGDFDRCFFFDENGQFIEGYYIVGLLAEAILAAKPGEKVIHDPRLTWNTINKVKNAGGTPVMSKTGHAFIKERMREENAIYGGEMSAHHYFRDFAYCDSGMIPWLKVVELLSTSTISLSQRVSDCMRDYPCSGEINYKVENAEEVLERIKGYYFDKCKSFDITDGMSFEFSEFRFNIRTSNTEPLLRLNVESRADNELLQSELKILDSLIKI